MPPFVATLLAQGLGLLGNAVMAKGKDFISDKLGVDVETLTQTPEGLLKLKQLELDHEAFLLDNALKHAELGLKDKALDIGNTQDARGANARIQESGNASWLAKNTIYLIAFLVILGGGWMLVTSDEADVRMAAVSAITLVLGFFFGSTQNGQAKDKTIAGLAQGGDK